MENVVDALKIAFAVLAFMLAIGVGVFVVNQTKEATDTVLRATEKKIDYTEELDTNAIQVGEKRGVGIETIIPTIYKYATERYTILFKDARGMYDDTGKITSSKFLPIYYTTNYNYAITWHSRDGRNGSKIASYINPYIANTDKKNTKTYDAYPDKSIKSDYLAICCFDISDEQERQEIFTQADERKKFLDVLIYGGVYIKPAYANISSEKPTEITKEAPDNALRNMKVEKKDSLAEKYKDAVFIEEVYEYTDDANKTAGETEDSDDYTGYLTRRVITYTLVSGG